MAFVRESVHPGITARLCSSRVEPQIPDCFFAFQGQINPHLITFLVTGEMGLAVVGVHPRFALQEFSDLLESAEVPRKTVFLAVLTQHGQRGEVNLIRRLLAVNLDSLLMTATTFTLMKPSLLPAFTSALLGTGIIAIPPLIPKRLVNLSAQLVHVGHTEINHGSFKVLVTKPRLDGADWN